MQTTTTGTALGTGTGTGVGTTAGVRMRIIGRADSDSAGPGPELMAADTLEGDRVVNLNGEDLGKITDIMLDVQRGRIAYAVMSVGGFLGIGDKLFAVPWSAMSRPAVSRAPPSPRRWPRPTWSSPCCPRGAR
mgnify:CR=1 FL=1